MSRYALWYPEARYSDHKTGDSGIVIRGVRISTGGSWCTPWPRDPNEEPTYLYWGCDICGAEWWVNPRNPGNASMGHTGWCRNMVDALVREERQRLHEVSRRVVKRTKARWV